ncbi:ABC transporter permease [Trueperella bialowiezensis]|uniref:Transport permease protein n=1 Tax=Trueperella bialowiezensis TaxID=312285 RepID=A0A448PGP3_9ACTO|nr:ABC transporter permease [Trueperella bialowiezensis]VEI14064.1 Daunorubicin/doxorubicin resistance ABC transporter permease protein drrB [Trueperella bialowiezensis]
MLNAEASATNPSTMRAFAGATWRNNIRLRRNAASLVSAFVIPGLFMVSFIAVFGHAASSIGFDYPLYLMAAAMFQAVMFTAGGSAMAMAVDIESGLIARLQTMPISALVTIGSRLATDLIRSLLSAGTVVLLGLLFGAQPDSAAGLLAAFLLAQGIGLVLGLASSGLALRSQHPVQTASLIQGIEMPLLMASTAFIPVATLPGWLQPIITHQPFSPLIDTIRALLTGGSAWHDGDRGGWLATRRARGRQRMGGTRISEALMNLVNTTAIHANRILLRWARSRSVLIMAAALPVVMIGLVLILFDGMVKLFTGSSLEVLPLSLMVAVGAAFTGALMGAGSIVQERHEGLPQRLATMPGRRSAPVLGWVAAETIRAGITVFVAFGLGLALGGRVGTLGAGLGVVAVLAVVALAAASVGVMLGYVVNTPQGAVSFVPLVMAAMFFNTAMMPRDMYAPALRPVVDVSPITAVAELVDGLVAGTPSTTAVFAFVAWYGGLIALSGVVLVRATSPRK